MGSINAGTIALEIIRSYDIKDPSEIDLEAIALDRKVFVNDINIEGSIARLQVKDKFGIISVDTNILEVGRRRFAIAHELGHFELHRLKFNTKICNEKDFLRWYKISTDEREANVFASELLMPTNIFRKLCPRDVPGFRLISELASMFNTSLTATAFKYVEIGYFPCALVASINGEIRWMCKSDDFPCRVKSIGTPLHKYSCAGSSLSGELLPDKPESVEVECWLEDNVSDRDLKLFEHSISFTNYNTILSLLFFN